MNLSACAAVIFMTRNYYPVDSYSLICEYRKDPTWIIIDENEVYFYYFDELL